MHNYNFVIVFLSSLVEQPEDVKELRCAGVLSNELGSDKEMENLFNKLNVLLVPETAAFALLTLPHSMPGLYHAPKENCAWIYLASLCLRTTA